MNKLINIVLYIFNLSAILGAIWVLGIRINVSPSQPQGLYRHVKNGWNKNDLVMACLPTEVGRLAVERNYIPSSTACDGHVPVIKRIGAIPEDRVVIEDSGVFINDRPVINTAILPIDTLGNVMNKAESHTVPDNHVFLISNSARNSWDSRYYGSIDESLILHKVEPLWVF